MIVFTDLDGTLLDRETYSFEPALPALAELAKRKIPVVPVTSKTAAETAALRERMRIDSPYIVENGGAVVFADGSRIVLGVPREQAREALIAAASESGAVLKTFYEMPLGEIQERANLPEGAAALAAQREYGEPFVLETLERADALGEALRARGFGLTRGGRFFHVLAGNDKARAVNVLAAQLQDADTVGLGDAPNDIEFLRVVRRPIVIPGPHLKVMREALPEAEVARAQGPEGWAQAMALVCGL